MLAVTPGEIGSSFRHDVEEQLDMLAVDRAGGGSPRNCVPETEVTGVDAGEDLADKGSPDRHR